MKRKNNQGKFDFGIYEVFYDDNGKVQSWTKDSLTPVSESEEELKAELGIMMSAFENETLIHKEDIS